MMSQDLIFTQEGVGGLIKYLTLLNCACMQCMHAAYMH